MHINHPKFNFQASWLHTTTSNNGKKLFYLKQQQIAITITSWIRVKKNAEIPANTFLQGYHVKVDKSSQVKLILQRH